MVNSREREGKSEAYVIEAKTIIHKIIKQQGYVEYGTGTYNHYFVTTLNEVQHTKIMNHCCTPETNIIL